ncbi:BZ3500_MvSof-1268-A1-R1_Chr10-2g03031 [Microbotryum saponariae]|uniref:non-specific serine/threonine protein kinase n=1 Tax=Microbotryum saponariae TaxID=289078 RepID=A0A2X0MBW6_9BASI|nr:BZ3501_MvSof-1269-A2-R1_Chr10-2g02617 [Microbotryum saponariae]SDA01963.1 BZ3500_MvSof-1268-A1-R1_Chr10-2g03031 [Microbotryum saponariae]
MSLTSDSSYPNSSVHTPGTSTPSSEFDQHVDPLPTFAQLDLSLSRDQGSVRSTGYGAGSEAHTLSEVAHSNHNVLASRILSRTSVGEGAGGALSPENLPKAPTELPRMPVDHVSAHHFAMGPTGSAVASTVILPSSVTASAAANFASTGTSGTITNPVSSTARTVNSVPSTTSNATTATTTTTTADKERTLMPPPATTTAPKPQAPVLQQKKSVFGKLFSSSNASNASLNSGSGSNGERMERGDSNAGSGTEGTGNGGASLARRPSKKEREQEKKEAKEREREHKEEQARLARRPSTGATHQDLGHGTSPSGKDRSASTSRPRAGSHGAKEKEGGMGQALNDFMRNKVQRKSSQTSRKSDDGRSDHDGTSTRGDGETRSRAGSQAGSLSQKYGVCEKMVIGKGATAVVKLAHKWDRSTERLYAVKEFRKRRKNETEKEYVKKLTSEFCISSTLHHHNIVETVDLVQDEQNHWCEVMEYCPGGDLYAAIKKGDMSPQAINSYFKQILAGVAYLHSMGVAHRDIKPENLLLDAKGHVKITDFGVSDVFRMCWEKTTHLSKGLCGSEPYIAPEQFEHKGEFFCLYERVEYDARLVDVWACAVVFYCMHFQELPWRVAKPSDPSFGPYMQMYGGQSTPPPLSNLVPRECRNIIRRMLDPDPKTRATTDQIISDPWFDQIKVIPPLEGILPPPGAGGQVLINNPPIPSPALSGQSTSPSTPAMA